MVFTKRLREGVRRGEITCRRAAVGRAAPNVSRFPPLDPVREQERKRMTRSCPRRAHRHLPLSLRQRCAVLADEQGIVSATRAAAGTRNGLSQ
jgi:hypothetical protein